MFKTTAVSQAIHHQAPNIHIDRIRVQGKCRHHVLGNGKWEFTDLSTGEINTGATPLIGTLGHEACTFYVRSKKVQHKGMAEELEIHVCPPQLLQRHNVFGHGDIVDYVYRIFDLLTKQLGIEVLPAQRALWLEGDFRLTEVHLTANFACPRADVLSIIDAIDANTSSGKHRNIDTAISMGHTDKRRSQYHVLSLYDKYVKLMAEWPHPGPLQAMILDAFRDSLRAEVKLFSQGLKRRDLQLGKNWRGNDIAALYFKILDSYNIRHAIQRLLTEDETNMLSLNERKVYLAWLNGTDVADQFASRNTSCKYIRDIRAKTGIDVGGHRRPEALPDLDLRQVFAPANVLPVPVWAHGTPCYAAPL